MRALESVTALLLGLMGGTALILGVIHSVVVTQRALGPGLSPQAAPLSAQLVIGAVVMVPGAWMVATAFSKRRRFSPHGAVASLCLVASLVSLRIIFGTGMASNLLWFAVPVAATTCIAQVVRHSKA